MAYVPPLKRRIIELEKTVALQKSLLDAFFTGDIPSGCTLDHMVLAKWGRKRLEEKAKQPALLTK